MGQLIRSRPVFSVAIPSYNHGKFIREAIQSVLKQEDCGDLEVVIVDDFSTDGSREIISEEAAADERITAVFHEENEGISSTVNEAKRLSRGEYLFTLASDDMLRQGALAKIREAFETPSPVGAIIFDGECVGIDGKPLGYCYSDIHPKPPEDMENVFRSLLRANFIMAGATRTSEVRDRGISLSEELRFLGDWVYWIDVASISDFRYLPEPLYIYRIHNSNSSFEDGWMEDTGKACGEILDRHWNRIDREDAAFLLYLGGLSYVKIGRMGKGRRDLFRSLGLEPFSRQGLKTSAAFALSLFGRVGDGLLSAYGKLRFSRVYGLSMHRIRKQIRKEEKEEKRK